MPFAVSGTVFVHVILIHVYDVYIYVEQNVCACMRIFVVHHLACATGSINHREKICLQPIIVNFCNNCVSEIPQKH